VHVLTSVEEDEIARLREREEFFWIDLAAPTDADIERLGRALDLHPVALEDTLEFSQRPKVDPYENQLLIVFYTARVPATPLEVHIYVSGGFIATIRHGECVALDELHQSLAKEPTHDEEVLVYRSLDGLTDAFYPFIEALEKEIDALEGEVLERPRRECLSRSYRLKQDVHYLLRLSASQRDYFHTARETVVNLKGFEKSTRPYLRDVGDHLTQIASELQRQTDDLNSLTQTYFTANSDRLNVTVTRLTVIGTFFVIWTVVTGFFGQNFGWLVDHINSVHTFVIFGVGGLIVPTVILLTVLWVKRDDWF
jgi:magnesium transporter